MIFLYWLFLIFILLEVQVMLHKMEGTKKFEKDDDENFSWVMNSCLYRWYIIILMLLVFSVYSFKELIPICITVSI